MENKKEDTFLSQNTVRSFVCHDSMQVYFGNMRVADEHDEAALCLAQDSSGYKADQSRRCKSSTQSAACGVISGVSAECQLSVSGYPQLLISIVTAGAKQAETARLLTPAPAIRANHRHHQSST